MDYIIIFNCNFIKLLILGENELHQQSSIKFHETSTNHVSSASFRWDTFVNYGEVSYPFYT